MRSSVPGFNRLTVQTDHGTDCCFVRFIVIRGRRRIGGRGRISGRSCGSGNVCSTWFRRNRRLRAGSRFSGAGYRLRRIRPRRGGRIRCWRGSRGCGDSVTVCGGCVPACEARGSSNGGLCCLEDGRVGSQSLLAMAALAARERPPSGFALLRLSPGPPSSRH